MQFEKEFKTAISHLPSKEKDRLILRLLKKDLVLANRLYFELVSANTVDENREKLEQQIIKRVELISERFYSVGYLMMDIRYLSGDITEHVKITKDKFGDASLNLLLLNETLRLNNSNINQLTPGKSHKLCLYIIAKAFKILILINVLHEDFRVEFNEQLITLGKLISESNYLMQTAINNGFDVNWLLSTEIPENIKEIHKEIKSQGFLK